MVLDGDGGQTQFEWRDQGAVAARDRHVAGLKDHQLADVNAMHRWQPDAPDISDGGGMRSLPAQAVATWRTELAPDVAGVVAMRLDGNTQDRLQDWVLQDDRDR